MSEEHTNNGQSDNESMIEDLRRKHAKADEGREPEFLSGRLGTRMISRRALLERIITAFIDEHGRDSQVLREADTEAKRLKLVLATVDYVLAVESIQVQASEKAEIIRQTYSELFTYGALDALLDDERVTTILLEGADKVSVRYGHGELTSLNPIFDDESHLRNVVRRLLRDAGTDFQDDQPLMEVGLIHNDKRIAVNVALPPITFQVTVDIRVHQSTLPTLDDLVETGVMTEKAKTLINAIAKSPHGIVIVGDTESGKTTLLSILANLIMQSDFATVERAGELRIADDIPRYIAQWGRVDESPLITFGEQLQQCLDNSPKIIVIDEVRADEAPAIRPLLANDDVPRQIWAFRGTSMTTRLVSALGMLARRADPSQSEVLVRKLYERLPFVIAVKRNKTGLHLSSISEWQFPDGAEYPDFVELMAQDWEGLELTGKRPIKALDLEESFWAE